MRTLFAAMMLCLGAGAAGLTQDQPQTMPATAPSLSAEAEVCTAVVDRMPSGGGTIFGADVGTLCCWSRITGAVGETTIVHIWSYNGKEMAVVELPVRSSSWRTHSRKNILPEWTGNWEVKVVDADGNTLKSVAFTVGTATTQ
ncbi:MAG: DUF2914 domain-containing protein [Candidatus Zixiibacteriota bacterium]